MKPPRNVAKVRVESHTPGSTVGSPVREANEQPPNGNVGFKEDRISEVGKKSDWKTYWEASKTFLSLPDTKEGRMQKKK